VCIGDGDGMNYIEELNKRKDVENKMTELAKEWCALCDVEQMDFVYLKDKVIFGEL
jgi:hypothetical protein